MLFRSRAHSTAPCPYASAFTTAHTECVVVFATIASTLRRRARKSTSAHAQRCVTKIPYEAATTATATVSVCVIDTCHAEIPRCDASSAARPTTFRCG